MNREQLTENTIILGRAGIVNDPRFCIRGLSTCACVCSDCMADGISKMEEFIQSLNH